jgi:hypothetical protein
MKKKSLISQTSPGKSSPPTPPHILHTKRENPGSGKLFKERREDESTAERGDRKNERLRERYKERQKRRKSVQVFC